MIPLALAARLDPRARPAMRWSLVAIGLAAWAGVLVVLAVGLLFGLLVSALSDGPSGIFADAGSIDFLVRPPLPGVVNALALASLVGVAHIMGARAKRLGALHAAAILLLGVSLEAFSNGSDSMLGEIVPGPALVAQASRATILGLLLVILTLLDRRLRNGPRSRGLRAGEPPRETRRVEARLMTRPTLAAGRAFLENLRAGAHLAFFRPVAREAFHVSVDQLGMLAGFGLLCQLGWEYLSTDAPIDFFSTGLAVHAAWLCMTFAFAWMVAREEPAPDAILRVLVMLLSTMPVAWLALPMLERATVWSEWFADWSDDHYWGCLFALWLAPLSAFVLRRATLRARSHCIALGLVYSFTVYHALDDWPSVFVLFTREAPEPEAPTPPPLDAEEILYAQPSRLEGELASLAPQRPATIDLYAVSFGADSRQDVFRLESSYVRKLLDRRFDTKHRSVLLVNHRSTVDDHPLATRSNLRTTLRTLGSLADPEEDIVLVYLTGHGSRDHELYVRFPELPLNRFGPDELDAMLDEAGIRNRVVIVSSCYSGAYVSRLADPNTLVMSASASDRTSFGCSNKATLTDFARAYFEEGLETDHDFVAAFRGAQKRIAAREKERKLKASLPQIAVGQAMRKKLRALRARLDAAEEEERHDRSTDATRARAATAPGGPDGLLKPRKGDGAASESTRT